jgi:ribosome-binding ATPase YchF (GTP1/OBG family)
LKIGLVGKPNVGKSTFFRAATLKDVATADYPFTTIEANVGVAYLRTKCPHKDLGTECDPAHGECHDGLRFVPIELVDVAGLVPGAHTGKGLGNKFLDDLRQADALIHIVDASGSSDAEGNPVDPGSHEPLEDVRFLEDEVTWWIDGILADGWDRLVRKADTAGQKLERILAEKLGGLGMRETDIHVALRQSGLDPEKAAKWDAQARLEFARAIRTVSKPLLVAFNKSDKVKRPRVEELGSGLGDTPWQTAAADAEVALRGAAKAGLIAYEPGDAEFKILDGSNLNAKQGQALEYVRDHVLVEHGSTGVLQALERAAYELLDLIVVYPVEDENKLTDKKGRVLPDAHLVPNGSTAKDLAYKVHTDLGDRFIRAVDARTKRVIGADHELKDGDVVTIVSDA